MSSLTETFIEAVGRAGPNDRDTRMEGGRGSSPRMEQQEVGWSRVEGGSRPAPQLDGQRSSWADVANNRYYSLSNHIQVENRPPAIMYIVKNLIYLTTLKIEILTTANMNILTTLALESMTIQ